ncbi:MAG: hypothetical protein LBD77_04060 [Bifidobacteriaceae bacterium]|nr:hypothetical protein [Bifidobacteriaceae bacterium]
MLIRLHAAGPDGWRLDREAEELMSHMAARFAALAAKHGLEAADGASAAFEAMVNPSVLTGRDPWAVIVRAVATSLRAWQFADEALCSIDTARRGGLSGRRVERFSERDDNVWDNHPALAVTDADALEGEGAAGLGGPGWDVPGLARELARVLGPLGWPAEETFTACEIVLRRLGEAGSRPACYEQLRRDGRALGLSGLPAGSWTGLLRLVLGAPGDKKALTGRGKGMLLRVALGESAESVAADPGFAAAARKAAPRPAGADGRGL